MAKITANGDTAYARWRSTRQSVPGAPYEMLLTSKGRLLHKPCRGESFKLRRRGVTFGQACAQAAMFRMDVAR